MFGGIGAGAAAFGVAAILVGVVAFGDDAVLPS